MKVDGLGRLCLDFYGSSFEDTLIQELGDRLHFNRLTIMKVFFWSL